MNPISDTVAAALQYINAHRLTVEQWISACDVMDSQLTNEDGKYSDARLSAATRILTAEVQIAAAARILSDKVEQLTKDQQP
jgi:hypothetical protein